LLWSTFFETFNEGGKRTIQIIDSLCRMTFLRGGCSLASRCGWQSTGRTTMTLRELVTASNWNSASLLLDDSYWWRLFRHDRFTAVPSSYRRQTWWFSESSRFVMSVE
jgi:hypothetical protein